MSDKNNYCNNSEIVIIIQNYNSGTIVSLVKTSCHTSRIKKI